MSAIPGGAALLGAVATLVLAIAAARARAQAPDSGANPGQIQQGNVYQTFLVRQTVQNTMFVVAEDLIVGSSIRRF